MASDNSMTISNQLCGSSMVLLFYDALITLDREVKYIWQAKRSWPQRVLWVCNRYMLVLACFVALGSSKPMSDLSCSASVWTSSLAFYFSTLGGSIFTFLRVYAISGRNRIIGGVMLVTCMAMIACNAITSLYIMPVNLPPPDNCIFVSKIDESLGFKMVVIDMVTSTLALSLATIVTWCKTRESLWQSTSRRRLSLSRVMFEYGMAYFFILLSLDLANGSLQLLLVSQPGAAAGAYGSYVTFFISPLSCLLTSRMMLDLYETNARIEAGADSTAGLFSLTLNNGGDRSRRGSLSMPEFVTSYGGPTHSLSDDERDDGDNHDEDTPGAGERSGNGGSQEAEGHPRDAGSPEPHAAVFTAL